MLGLAYTLKHDGHVRVDIFYRGYSAKTKALVNFVGGVLFLLPLCGLLFFVSWDYVLASWAIRETSAENNGLPLFSVFNVSRAETPLAIEANIKTIKIIRKESLQDPISQHNATSFFKQKEPSSFYYRCH